MFTRFPELRICLLECGFAWLPPLLWRFDKDWKSVWPEVPWVRERPSALVRRHLRASVQPAPAPPDPAHLRELLEMVGTGWLLYASDHPHDHGPGADLLLEALDEAAAEAVRWRNATEFYGLGPT